MPFGGRFIGTARRGERKISRDRDTVHREVPRWVFKFRLCPTNQQPKQIYEANELLPIQKETFESS